MIQLVELPRWPRVAKMSFITYSVQALLIYFTFTHSQDVPCKIDFGCEECLPDYVPMITSHHLNGSVLEILSGDKVTFFCHKTNFLAFGDKNLIRAFCENDKYRIIHDTSIRHLTDLGCQTSFLEDILHHVDDCSLPSQGRSYQYEDKDVLAVRHLAELCYDQDQARTVFAHTTTAPGNSLPQHQHSDSSGPLSFIGNLNHMLDTTTKIEADKIYSDAKKINKRMYELLKHYDFNFAGNSLRTTKLLSPYYFKDQNMMVTNFASNKIAMWQSVAEANMMNVNKDVSRVIDAAVFSGKQLDIYVGTHGVLTLTSHNTPVEIYLKSHKRFPVPKYVWTIIADKKNHKGVAIIVLNNPFLVVSEIRNSVFCNSECSKLTWLHHLTQNNNYETPMYGLVFCCNVHSFAETVKETPKDILDKIHAGNDGLMTFIPTSQ